VSEGASSVHLTRLAVILIGLIRETVDDLIPFDAVSLELRSPGPGGEEEHFGTRGAVLTLRSAAERRAVEDRTAELTIWLGETQTSEAGDWIDVVLNDGGRSWEIYNNGATTTEGEPVVLDELRQLVRGVIEGRDGDTPGRTASFAPYPARAP
jgi:hypothetical protein